MPQVPEKLVFNAKILEFAEESTSNDIYITVKLILLTSEPNLNNVQFSPEFINEIAINKQKYLTIPLVAEIDKLNKKQYGNLTHKYNKKTGTFGTSMIGSFVDFSTEEVDSVLRLIGECRIPKRFTATVEALQELYDQNQLLFSYEILVSEFTVSNGIKYVDVNENNSIIGMAVVSDPAVPAAQAFLLVAALEKDFNLIEGGEIVPKARSKEMTMEEFFADVKVNLTEKGELDLTQIRRKIFSQLDNVLGSEWWNYDLVEMGINYIILLDYQNGDYYKMDYSIEGENVVLSEKYKVSKNYTKIEEAQKEMAELKELQDSLAKALAEVETLKTQITTKDTVIAEKEKLIKEKETALATANTTIAEKEANIVKLGETITTKDAEIATLTPFKATVEKAELEKAEAEKVTKRAALTAKCVKILSKEELETAEMKKAIEDLDENYVNKVLAEKYVANATKGDGKKPVITASRITDSIDINGSDTISKYVTLNK